MISQSNPTDELLIFRAYQLVQKQRWFGYTLFWAENYYKNKESYLEDNMWIGVHNQCVQIIDVQKMEPLKRYKLDDWNFYHLPNALMIGKNSKDTV